MAEDRDAGGNPPPDPEEPALDADQTEVAGGNPPPGPQPDEPGAPDVDVIGLLRKALAGLRAQGVGFDEAWPAAPASLPPAEPATAVRGGGWRRAPRSPAAVERASTLEALAATVEEWRAAYTGAPSALPRPRAARALDRELAA